MNKLEDILHNNTQPKGKYCFKCGNNKIKSINTPEGEYFLCEKGHQLPRVYIFDDVTIQHIEGGILVHETVGAIIKRLVNNQYLNLLFLRRKFPFQYTIPAGHLEYNETPEQAVQREVEEETGLEVLSVTSLYGEAPPKLYDPCRRGADFHYWHLFSVETSGEPTLSDEGRIIGWYTDEEVNQFKQHDLLTPPLMKLF